MFCLKNKQNKRLDFLPNKQNKYSIRKFTVGTASILVGAALIFGSANDEAKAAEKIKFLQQLIVMKNKM